jgi:transposase
MASTKRDSGREAFWRRIMVEFRKSGLTVREFCRRRKLHESAFYFWRRTIQDRTPTQHCRKAQDFVPLVLGSIPSSPDIVLDLRGGRVLRLSESFPVERLAGLIRALEAEGRT